MHSDSEAASVDGVVATSIGDAHRTSVAKTEGKDAEMALVSKAPKPDKLLGVRHLQVFLLFLAILVAYTLRVNISVAIVAMTDSANANPDYPEYDWDEGTVALILSSFFWGYVITQVPAGVLAQKVGPKPLLVGSLFFASLFSMVTPLAARWGGWGLVVFFRVLQGLSQGFLFPSTHTLLARWCPVEERGVFSTFVYAGAQLGTVFALPLCGVLSVSGAGWPSCFYIFGSFGIAWSVLWFFLGSNSPEEHPFISKEERDFIHDSLGHSSTPQAKPSVPWKPMLSSLPMWSIVVANAGHAWGFWTLLTEMPTFMKNVLGFDLKSNGLLSALPYLAMFLLSFVFSSASGYVNRKELVSTTASRKIFNSIGLWGPAISLIGLSYATDSTTAIALLTLAVGINSAIYVGYNVNHIDLAPNFAGTMMGISNGSANVVSLFGPLVVGAVVYDSSNADLWRIVFFIAAGVYFVTNTFFLIFATANLQPWNEPKHKKHLEIANISGAVGSDAKPEDEKY